MTFEEFLIKKKIDLVQLKSAEPGLFSEFQSHYTQMGEKSFDHSKKFLFNKLRRAYHLKEEPKPIALKDAIKVNELAAQAEPLLSPTVEATVYTPRLKPATTTPPAQALESTENIAAEQPKPAFKPRFKPGLTSSSEAKPADESVKEEKPTAETTKPAYTPRFKPAVTPQAEGDPEIKETTPSEQTKPAFKPRFKSDVTNTQAPPQPKEETAEEKPKPAYMPRFKATVTDATDEQKPEVKQETPRTSDPVPQASEEQAKPAYKPRFKPAMVKPKGEE